MLLVDGYWEGIIISNLDIRANTKNRITICNLSKHRFRNPGKQYGGKLNVSHMGTYDADKRNLSISFEQSTIVRRLNVHGIKLRTMVVVSSMVFEIEM